MENKIKTPKLPKAFSKPLEKKNWDKKVMGKIFLPEDRDFLDSLKKESGGKFYIEPSDLDKKQMKRLKGLSKIIIANRKGLSFPLLFIALLSVTALLTWHLFLKTRILTQMAENQLEKVFQAEVEIKGLNASILQASLSANEVIIADKSNPMRNLVEMKSLEATLNPQQLLRGRIHITELGFSGLERGTERETSGILESSPGEDEILIEQQEESNIVDRISASLGQIDPADILEKEMSNLQSPALIKETQATYEQYRDQWEEEILSWEGKVEEWEESAAFIKSINPESFDSLEEAQSTLERLNRIGNSARDDLRKAEESFNEAQTQWNRARGLYERVQAAIQLDYKYLEGLVSMSGGEKLNWVAGILDDQMGSYISKYLSYWQKGRQWLNKLQNSAQTEDKKSDKPEGRRIPMGPDAPPKFLLNHAYASGREGNTDYNIELYNLSNAPERWDRPVQLLLNWENPETGPVEAVIEESGATMNFSRLSFDLNESLEPLGIRSVSGYAGLQADLIRNQNTLSGTIIMTIPEFHAVSAKDDPLSRAITGTLESTKNTRIANSLTLSEGTLTMNIESDLDSLLNQALGSLLVETGKESARMLKEAFRNQSDGPLKELDNSLSALGMNIEEFESLENSMNTLDDLSEQKKDEIQDHIKRELENQASDLLNNLPGGFF